MSILDRIDNVSRLKELSIEELNLASKEIRQVIIRVVAANGGHLSSNLGAVDLTLALHRVFDAPRDKIIWDIGHQCYTHKIVTGRKDRIHTIRTQGGLMGYPDIHECEYDVINVGHASTSLGFAAGMAIARDHNGGDFHIVNIIGDGALTGGVALEALNHIGQVKPRLIIVLNDNKMSISPNVGGISKHLNYLVSGRPYIRLKEVTQNLLRSIPAVGKSMFELARKVEILARTMLVPGSLFDELGIKYIGPINGHSIAEMVKEFEEAKKYTFPVLLHVVTRKGEGYEPATNDPSSYHSSHPFDIQNGKFLNKDKSISYSEVFGQTAVKLADEDPKVIALTAAMPEGTGLDQVQKKYPERFFDVGIAEQYLFDFAGGLARGGLRPVVGVYSTFLQRAVDQIIHDISLMEIPMVVGLDRAGLVGGDGPTHQGIYDIPLLLPVPNLVFMAPKDENELQHMVYSAHHLGKPAFIRYPKEPGRGVPLDLELKILPEGKAEVMREGGEGSILAVGPLVWKALAVAERLASGEKRSLTVVNVRFLKPMDTELLERLAAGGRPIITLEDGSVAGGFGQFLKGWMGRKGAPGPAVLALGIPEGIVPLASRSQLLALYGLDEEGIFNSVRRFLAGR